MALPRFCSNCAAPLPHPPPVTCRSCDTSHWLDAKPCAGALVTCRGRLMLVRRAHEPWRGSWDVPGGFCGPREHPRDAAAREVREETGLSVEMGGVLGMWIDTYAPEGPEADKVTLSIYFHATVESPATTWTDPNEVAEIGWFSPDDLPADVAFPGHIPEVLRAWRESPEAAARTSAAPAPALRGVAQPRPAEPVV
jgi:ADP-ribose pyrophosphatase YjhB (NUDIX family)